MLTALALGAAVVVLLWIASILAGIHQQAVSTANAIGQAVETLQAASDHLAQSQATLADRIEGLGALVAYRIAEDDSPLSGLQGEPDYTFEKDMTQTELKLLYRARRACRQFAGVQWGSMDAV